MTRSALAATPGVLGDQRPRVELVPDGEDHEDTDAVLDFASACGIVLDPWQEYALRVALRRRNDRWAAFAVAVCAPRQNGKNGITEVRELAGPLILGEPLLIHSAHLADTSREAFRRLEGIIDANEWLSKDVMHIWRTNGHEAIEFRGGGRIRFRTRTKGGGRGFSGSPVFFDEPMFLPEISMGAILPVVSAQPDPQIWYTGSAVDQTVHEDGLVFSRVRQRALAGEDPRLAYMEWSLDFDTPDQVPDEVAADPEAWARSNPALGIRIDPEYVQAERRDLDPRTFAVERLGVGDWPDPAAAGSVIPIAKWNELADSNSQIPGLVVFAYDVSPDRAWSTIAAAGQRDDGRVHVEVVDRRRGTGWVAERAAELHARHENLGWYCDGAGPAGSLMPELQQAGVTVDAMTAGEHGRACGVFFDAVEQATLRHRGQPEMSAAIRGAAVRPLGDAWAWSRKNSAVDITPLVASTLAHWGAYTSASDPFVVFAS